MLFPCTVTLTDAMATRQLGIDLGQRLLPGSVLLLEGDLGSGKTTLVQGIGAGLGITDPIDSPTFTLVNEYLEGRSPLYHVDLYRLNAVEIVGLSLEMYWNEAEVEPGIVAIEWADRLQPKPIDYLLIQLRYTDSGKRQITLTPVGQFNSDQLIELLTQFKCRS